MTFGFMLPISLSADSAIFFEAPNRSLDNTLSIEGHTVTVRPDGKIDSAGARGIAALGTNFSTAETATEVGRKARAMLLAAGAIRRVGMQTGAGEDIEDPNGPTANLSIRQHFGRLNVHVESPGRDFVSLTGSLTQGQAISEVLKIAQAINPDSAERISSAAELYGLSRFLESPRARFLTLMSSIEVQLQRSRRPENELQLISTLINEVHKSLGDAGAKLASALGTLRHVSIGTAMRIYVERLLSVEEAEFCEKCYGWRGKLSHAGTAVPELESAVEQLDVVVSNLITKASGFQEG